MQRSGGRSSFVQDVQPALSRMGCTQGTCHGAREGKSGFKLSLRGYDPQYDHVALTDDVGARRMNRAAPDQSLMLLAVPDAHLCCGSAGTYSILQQGLAQRLLRNKVGALESGGPDVIATANIGCLAHIQSGMRLPARHWIELLDASVSPR